MLANESCYNYIVMKLMDMFQKRFLVLFLIVFSISHVSLAPIPTKKQSEESCFCFVGAMVILGSIATVFSGASKYQIDMIHNKEKVKDLFRADNQVCLDPRLKICFPNASHPICPVRTGGKKLQEYEKEREGFKRLSPAAQKRLKKFGHIK